MKFDHDWVEAQLKASRSTPPIDNVVKKLLGVMEDVNLPDDMVRIILDDFHRLALGHALAPPKAPERWGPVVPGEYRIGDTVRVRLSAYTGEKGVRHNGKRGRVTGVRGGQTIVMYDEAKSTDEQWHHDPRNLERLL